MHLSGIASDMGRSRRNSCVEVTEIDPAIVGGRNRLKPISETVAMMLVVTLISVLIIFLSGSEVTMWNFRGLNYYRGLAYHWGICFSESCFS